MSHGIWVQRTAYNVQGYNNVPWGMDEQTVSPGRLLMAYIYVQGITVFLGAWMSRQSLLHLKHSGGMDSVASATGKCMSGRQPDILSQLEIPGGAFNWDRKWTSGKIFFF